MKIHFESFFAKTAFKSSSKLKLQRESFFNKTTFKIKFLKQKIKVNIFIEKAFLNSIEF